MQETVTLRQKILKYVFSAIQLIFGLFVLFFLFGTILTLFNWAVGGFQDSSLIQASGLFLFMIFFMGIIVVLVEKGLRRLGLKREVTPVSSKEWKEFAMVLLAMVSVVALTYLVNQFFAQFPETISANLDLEIMKTIIQTNGFLIGFSGVVFGQMFWAINHQQNTIQANILENPKLDQTSKDMRKDYVALLDKKRRSMAITMAFVIGLFVLSIVFSLSAIARTEFYATELVPTIPEISNPLFFMIGGIIFFVISIATSKLSLEGV